jgi:hypothetical protein
MNEVGPRSDNHWNTNDLVKTGACTPRGRSEYAIVVSVCGINPDAQVWRGAAWARIWRIAVVQFDPSLDRKWAATRPRITLDEYQKVIDSDQKRIHRRTHEM